MHMKWLLAGLLMTSVCVGNTTIEEDWTNPPVDALKFADHLFGPTLCAVMSALNPKSRNNPSGALITLREPKRILVVRPGGIGDMVLLLPCIKALSNQYPTARIDVVCEKRNFEVLKLAGVDCTLLPYDGNPANFLSATVLRGPLVYSLRIGENWQKFRGDDAHPDYEVLPTTPWNYGLILDEKNPEKSFKIVTKPMTDPVYSSNNAPVELHARGRIVPSWKEARNSADLPPVSPVKSTEPIQDIVLIPYGCAKLRITEFPVIDESDNSSAN